MLLFVFGTVDKVTADIKPHFTVRERGREREREGGGWGTQEIGREGEVREKEEERRSRGGEALHDWTAPFSPSASLSISQLSFLRPPPLCAF